MFIGHLVKIKKKYYFTSFVITVRPLFLMVDTGSGAEILTQESMDNFRHFEPLFDHLARLVHLQNRSYL